MLGFTAKADYKRSLELDPTDINALWMAKWVSMGKEHPGAEMAQYLEEIVGIDPRHYVAYVCKGVALSLHGKLKEGLAALEQAIALDSDQWDAYFWKGMLRVYFYSGHDLWVLEPVEKAVGLDLPPVLLTPLYWLEKDRPDFFEKYVRPLLEHYGVE